MKYFKLTLIGLFIGACSGSISTDFFGDSQSEIGMMPVNEPYTSSRISADTMESDSISQGEYILKSAYGSVDVSSSNFDDKVSEFQNLVKQYG